MGRSEHKFTRLVCGPLTVDLDGIGGGFVTSELKDDTAWDHTPVGDEEVSRAEYNAAIDAVESLVLSHACAGIDITQAAYVEGVITSLDSISNRLG